MSWVGKTRLFYEFTRSHPPSAGSCSKGLGLLRQGHAYLPIRDLLRSYFQIEERDDERRIRERLIGKLLTLDAALGPTSQPS